MNNTQIDVDFYGGNFVYYHLLKEDNLYYCNEWAVVWSGYLLLPIHIKYRWAVAARMGQHSSKGHKSTYKVDTTEIETLVGSQVDVQTDAYGSVKDVQTDAYGTVKHTDTLDRLVLEDTEELDGEPEAAAEAHTSSKVVPVYFTF